MKKLLLLTFLLVCCASMLFGQRYLEEIFDDVTVQTNEVYAQNVDFLLPVPRIIPLTCDVYAPADDTETNRPAIMLSHSGSFIPRIINNAYNGAKDDSVIVELSTQLARRGFVVFAYTYRQGWDPEAVDDNIRQGSLLRAAYRGVQDTRCLARWIRRGVAENANPYGVDPDKIAAWGVGTGSYLSYGAAMLDDPDEVQLEKFRDGVTFEPFVDTLVMGNFDGTTFGIDPASGDTLSLPNHVGYRSDIQLAVNMGGALGDASWIDGDESSNEPPVFGFHCTTDIFGPYYIGPVVVATNGFIVLDEASGTRQAIELANDNGLNEVFDNLTAEQDPLADIIQSFKDVDITINNETISIGTDNFYPFVGLNENEGSPWDWWSLPVLTAQVAFINQNFGLTRDAQAIHEDGLATNPDMSAEKARRYIDTIMMVAAPRLCVGLGLGCEFSSVSQIDAQEVNFQLAPNPARGAVTLTSASDQPIEEVRIFSTDGQLLKRLDQINNSSYRLPLEGLSSGMYMVAARFADGIVIERLMVK